MEMRCDIGARRGSGPRALPWWRERRRRRAGRCSTAMRSARAKALKTVSHWWCALSPRRLSMCSVARAWFAKPWKNSCVRSTSNSPTRARVKSTCNSRPGSPGEVHDHARQRLVERNVGVAVAADALLVAQRLGHRHAERDADVLDRVVGVDVQVALGAHGRGRWRRGARPGRACGRGTGCRRRASPRRVPSRSTSTRICVSLVSRWISRLAHGCQPTAGRAAPSSRVVLVGGSDGEPQAVGEQWMRAVEVANQYTTARFSDSNAAGASGTRTSTKFAADGKRATRRHRVQGGLQARRARRTMRVVCSSRTVAMLEQQLAGRRGQRVHVVGQAQLLEFARSSRELPIASPRRNPARPSLRDGAHQQQVRDGGRPPAAARRRPRTRSRPRRRRPGPAPRRRGAGSRRAAKRLPGRDCSDRRSRRAPAAAPSIAARIACLVEREVGAQRHADVAQARRRCALISVHGERGLGRQRPWRRAARSAIETSCEDLVGAVAEHQRRALPGCPWLRASAASARGAAGSG